MCAHKDVARSGISRQGDFLSDVPLLTKNTGIESQRRQSDELVSQNLAEEDKA